MTAPLPPRAPQSIAIPFAVASGGIALFSIMDALMKHLVGTIGTYNGLLWRTMAGALVGGLIFAGRRMRWPADKALRLHLIRGFISAMMAALFFWGLGRVPLAQGVTLAFVAPLIALYLAAVLLGERIERRAIMASLLGLAGVAVIVSGQVQADLGPEALMGSGAILLSACLYAYNIILMRKQAQVAGPFEIAFFMSAILTCCYLPFAPFLAEVPPVAELPAILGAAALSFFSLLLLSWAYARAEAQHLAPVEYTAFIWAVTLGYIVFDEPVSPFTVVGAGMIIAACLVAALRRKPGEIGVEAA